MDNKKLLRNLYTLAKYHAESNRLRANDLLRAEDSIVHGCDLGLADAYEAIVFFLNRPELLECMDYAKIMHHNIELPEWLKDDATEVR